MQPSGGAPAGEHSNNVDGAQQQGRRSTGQQNVQYGIEGQERRLSSAMHVRGSSDGQSLPQALPIRHVNALSLWGAQFYRGQIQKSGSHNTKSAFHKHQ